ncbi:MAG: Bax inhibitor-1/YccA family protein [Arachidicoccus sp.]|nr:Bax inhibitor-1/YccA family protein [Arachidicoccus sp.]
MALFNSKSGNPAMSEKIFDKSLQQYNVSEGTMTVNGSIGKFGFLLLMVIGGAFYTWSLYYRGEFSLMQTMMFAGIFGGLVTAIAITINQKLAKYLAPLYGILEGFFLGSISAFFNDAFAQKAPGIVPQAVGLTFAVGLAMLALYRFGVIKVTDRLRSVIISATLGIALFYLVTWILSLFHVNVGFMYNSSLLGIGISLFVVVIAAMNLLLDFDMIYRGSQLGAPKYMEWYGAFGLLITMVWLYLEILRLLSRVYGRK